MVVEEEQNNKYAWLLQPVKDLEKNFGIDIAGLLQDYQTQLADIAETEQFRIDNEHRFNFTEAAMLLQGSTSVFGKKVDLLHTQAMNFFESLKTAKAKKKKGGDEDEGIEDDDDCGEGGGAMDDGVDAFDPCVLIDYSNFKPCDPMQLVMKRKKKVEIPSISVMPMSLMPLADHEKCNVPIYARKNSKEVIGKKDDFKINTGYIGKGGALLLDLLNAHLIDDFASDEFMKLGACKEDDKEKMGDSGRGSPEEDGAGQDSCPIGDVDFGQGGVTVGGRPSEVEFNRRRTELGGTFVDANGRARPSTVLLINGQDDMDCDFGDGGTDDDDIMTDEKPLDPWEVDNEFELDPCADRCLDEYEKLAWRVRPYKEVACTTSAKKLCQRKKAAEAKMTMRQMTLQTHDFINDHFHLKTKQYRVAGQKKGDWEVEIVNRYIINQQRNRALKKIEEKKQRKEREKRANLPANLDDDDLFGGYGLDDDEFDNLVADDGQRPNTQGASQPQSDDLMFGDIADEDLNVSINVPTLYIGKRSKAGQDNFDYDDAGSMDRPPSGMGLQDVLQFYMKKYWTAAAEATSRLAVRVQEWEEKMQPMLEEEETRKEFDIHQYGGEMLNIFGGDGDQKSFAELLVGKKDYEISRYFLSTLMLANTYNVEVVDDQQLGKGLETNTMQVKLLKRDRHHDVFDQDGAL